MPKRPLPAGRVDALFHKKQTASPLSPPLLPAAQLTFLEHRGMVEQSASPLSPRQVLLTDLEDLEDLGLLPGALRENVVLSGVHVSGWPSGTVLRVGGSGVELRLAFACEPCGHILDALPPTVRQGLGPDALKRLAGRRGVLATVVRGGTVRLGDECVVEGAARYEPMADQVRQRVRWLLQRVPSGRVLTYMDAIGMVGAPSGFARALPAYLKAWAGEAAAGSAEALPVHRMTATSGALLERHLPGQREALEAEGVPVRIIVLVDPRHRCAPPPGCGSRLAVCS